MSIRIRLFLSITGLIVFFVVFSLFLNSQYLGQYYVSQKKDSLIETKDLIEKMYKGDPDAISFQLENLERNTGMNISFIDVNHGLLYNSFRIFDTGGDRRPPDGPTVVFGLLDRLQNLGRGDYIIGVNKDPRLKTNFLVLASTLTNGDTLILSTPLAAINESTAIANRFFLFTGLVTIVLGGIAVFLYTKRFTRPILELNGIAQGMSELDFSKKYLVESNDEIGQLGSSINSLSDQLDKAITDLTEANNKLREDIDRERQIDKMRKEFISNVSHELKTPIALIQGYAEGLKLNINENAEDRDFYCDVIMDETDKMNRLVKDLLDLSQIESGYFKLEKSVFDISKMVDYLLDKYRPILTEKELQIEVEKSENVDVHGDAGRIEQVLVNYLNNAINHVDEHKTIKITLADQANKVLVSVFNTGKNIPGESLDKIWTSFYKVDKARTRAYGGTGLGLSVVRSVLELHQNAYGVENEETGVRFWFEIDRP